MGQTRIDLLINLEYQKQLEQLKKELKSSGDIKINTNVNLSEVQRIKTQLDSMLGGLKDFKFTTNASGQVKNFFATYQNELNQTITAQYKLNEVIDAQGNSYKSLDLVSQKYIDSVKKREQGELKSNEAMENAFISSEKRKRKERESVDAAQLKAIEKVKQAELNASLQKQEFEKQRLANLKQYSKEYERIATLQSKGGFDFSKQSILEGGKLVGKGVISETPNITKFFQDIDDGTGKIRRYTMETDKATNSTRILSSGWKEASRNHMTFNQELSIAIRRIAEWAVATNLVYGSLHALGDGVRFIYDLSNSLNEIRIVTGKSVEDVNRLAKGYNDLAIAMGSTTGEITKSSVEYYRQGLSQEETNKRMEATIKYSKISGLAMKDSTDIITASANATKQDVEKIIDVFALLGRFCPSM